MTYIIFCFYYIQSYTCNIPGLTCITHNTFVQQALNSNKFKKKNFQSKKRKRVRPCIIKKIKKLKNSISRKIVCYNCLVQESLYYQSTNHSSLITTALAKFFATRAVKYAQQNQSELIKIVFPLVNTNLGSSIISFFSGFLDPQQSHFLHILFSCRPIMLKFTLFIRYKFYIIINYYLNFFFQNP